MDLINILKANGKSNPLLYLCCSGRIQHSCNATSYSTKRTVTWVLNGKKVPHNYCWVLPQHSFPVLLQGGDGVLNRSCRTNGRQILRMLIHTSITGRGWRGTDQSVWALCVTHAFKETSSCYTSQQSIYAEGVSPISPTGTPSWHSTHRAHRTPEGDDGYEHGCEDAPLGWCIKQDAHASILLPTHMPPSLEAKQLPQMGHDAPSHLVCCIHVCPHCSAP